MSAVIIIGITPLPILITAFVVVAKMQSKILCVMWKVNRS